MGDMRMHANKSTEMNDCEAVTEIDGLFMELIRRLLVDCRVPYPSLKPPGKPAEAQDRESVSLAKPSTVKIVKDRRRKPPIQRGINA